MQKKFKLAELGEFKNGANYPKGSYGKGDRIINVKDLFKGRFINEEDLEELKKDALKNKEIYLVENGDILFTRSSLVRSGAGMCAMINNPQSDMLFCGFIIRYRIKNKEVYPLYLLYLLRSPRYRKLFTGSQQTNITNINQDTLGNIDVYLPVDNNGNPDINKQKQIVRILDVIDTKIENNIKIKEELEKIFQIRYRYWFLQFNFPDENGEPYKFGGGKMKWDNILKREIPINWNVQNLNENNLTDIIKPGIQKFEGNKTYLATGDVENNDIVTGSKITYKNRESRANMQPAENSVWFAKMKNSVKHICVGEYCKELLDNYIFSTGFLGLKCKKKEYFEYVNSFICDNFFEIQKDKLAHGATQEAINNNDVRLIPMLIPDDLTLNKFHNSTKNILKKIYLINCENKNLKSCRDFLLPLLMNGQAKL